MEDGMDDSRSGLEEEYFNRKNSEAIEKLRARIKLAAEAKAAGMSTMSCPRCGGNPQDLRFQISDLRSMPGLTF